MPHVPSTNTQEQLTTMCGCVQRLEKQLQEALDDLDKARAAAEDDLEKQVETLSADLLEQVLPEGSEPQASPA